jgi:SAM-dependent methyltransferase
MTLKFTLVQAVRSTGMLKPADNVKFWLGRARTHLRNARFTRQHPTFAAPPADLAFDAYNHVDWQAYHDSGLAHARLFARLLTTLPAAEPLRVLEWGCGPARLIRHLPQLMAPRSVELTGSDYNPRSIAWCRDHVPGVRFVENGLTPPLPLPDASFDAVYNFSVLTHLSETVQLQWVREMHRVLRPGGLLICTTHGKAYRYLLSMESERARFDAGELVEQGRYEEGKKWFFAVHPERWLREKLFAGFEDVQRVSTTSADAILQDVWTARKPGLLSGQQ